MLLLSIQLIAGELDGKQFTFDKLCTYRAAILSTYETIYTILKKDADTINNIRNNPMIKNIVDLARKEKVASKPPEIQMTWDITQVFQLWYNFPSSRALSIIPTKIPKCDIVSPHNSMESLR